MRRRFLIVLLLLCCLACSTESEEKSDLVDDATETETKFDKRKWGVKKGKDYPYREQMLNNIVYSDSVRALSKDEILELLGKPDRSNDGYLYYMIAQKRLGFWPLHTKTMVIKLSEDTSIDWIKIHE